MGLLPPTAVERLAAVHSGERTKSRFALHPHAFHVFGVRHRLKMLRIAARGVVAKMIHVVALRNWAVRQLPRSALRLFFLAAALAGRKLELPVAFMKTRRPRPTFVWPANVNLIPKTLHNPVYINGGG